MATHQKTIIGMNKTITKEEIDALPQKSFDGKISIPLTEYEIEEAVDYLRNYSILGFDTETRPNFLKGQRHKVALLQLSTDEHAYLFRINKIGLPKSVISILTDNTILKVGAAIHDDIKALRKINEFTPDGFIDLQTIAHQVGIEHSGLKPLSALLLGFKISKSQQTSNWENIYLSEAQQRYAATDAWVSLEIYKKLTELSGETTEI